MKMEEALLMGICNFLIIDFTEPVVCSNGTGIRKNEASQTPCDRRVLFDTPVFFGSDVSVDEFLVVD